MTLQTLGSPEALQKDLKTLAVFIQIYCRHHHPDVERALVSLPWHHVTAIVGREVILCAQCTKLLTHAFVKRTCCPMDPKPMCKHCPNHCYHPKYRAQIRKVMKFSGRTMVLHGRLDYLFHLLF